MRFRSLCESAKKGHVCMDDICRGCDITLCGFDKEAFDEMIRDDYRDDLDDREYDDDLEECE